MSIFESLAVKQSWSNESLEEFSETRVEPRIHPAGSYTAPGQPCDSQDLRMNTLSDEMDEQQNIKHGKLYNSDLASSKKQIAKKQKKEKF